MSEEKKEHFFFLFLVGLALLIFAPSFQIPFISDEIAFIKRNAVSDLSQLPSLFAKKDYDEFYYRPLGNFVSGVVTFFAGEKAPVYRFFNLMLHIANTFIFFQFAKIISRKIENKFFAPSAALLFLVFPANDYVLLWHTALFDRLLLGIYLLGLLSFLKNHRVTIPSIIFFILAMLSKEAAFSFPFVIFIADHFLNEERTSLWSSLKKSGIYFLLLVGFLLLRIILFNNNVFTAQDAHSAANVFTIIKNYFFFGGFLLFPFSPREVQHLFLAHQTLAIIIGGIGVIAFTTLLYKKKSDKLFWFLFLFLILTILPSSRLFMRWYLYLPSTGFILLLCFLAFTTFKTNMGLLFTAFLLLFSLYTFFIIQKELKWLDVSKKAVIAIEELNSQNSGNTYSSIIFLTIPAKVGDIPVYQLQFETLAQYYLKTKVKIDVLSKSYFSSWDDKIHFSAKSDTAVLQHNKDNYFLLFDNKKNLNFDLKSGKQLSFPILHSEGTLFVFFSQGKFHKIIGQL